MDKIILLISFFLFANCQIKLGGFEKDSFESNDIRVDKAWRTVETEYYKQTGHNKNDAWLYRVSIYKQLVSGINYKISFVAHDRDKNKVKTYEYIVLCGLTSNNGDPFPFELVSTKELSIKDIPVNNSKYGKINNMVNSFSKQKDDKIAYVNTIQSSEAMFGTGIHIVLGQSKKIKATNSYIVFEDEVGNFEVLAQLR